MKICTAWPPTWALVCWGQFEERSFLDEFEVRIFTVGGIMCGSLVGIFVGALAVNASLGYMILLLGAWGLCLYITSRSLMDDARREEAVLNQPAEEFDDPDELPPLYWEGYDRGYEEALESMAYTRPPRVRPPKSKKKGA